MIGVARACFDPDVEAAMIATYGRHPLDYSLPQAGRLIRRLPPGMLPYTDTQMAWSTETHMLASLIEQIQWLTWVTVAANSKKKPDKPKPVKRPGAKKQIDPA